MNNAFEIYLYSEELKMAFIKVRDKKSSSDSIINTDLISRIAQSIDGYIVYFSSGNPGATFYEYDYRNANKIFRAIGVSLEDSQ